MKIHELQLTRDVKKLNPDDMENILQKYGWKLLGSGNDAAVAQHPNKRYVLKLFLSDSNYTKFVEIAKDNIGNPHFPKFSRYIKPIPHNAQFSYVRMEKLKPVTSKILEKLFVPEMVELRIIGLKHNINVGVMPDFIAHHYLINNDFKFEDLHHIDRILEIRKTFDHPVDDTWIVACNAIAEAGKGLNHTRLDLHSGNFMQRGKKTLVILDPFA